MGTCLSTQSAGRRTRRRRVSISPSSAEHAADRKNNNNCGGRSGDDSVSQQQQGGSSDSVTSTSPAPGGPSAGGAGQDGGFSPPPPQSGQEWTLERSSPPLPSRSPANGAISEEYPWLRSNEKAASNPLLPVGISAAADTGSQGLLPMTHTRLSSPLVVSDGDNKHQSGRKTDERHSTPPSNTDNTRHNKETNLSNTTTTTTNSQRSQSKDTEEGVARKGAPSIDDGEVTGDLLRRKSAEEDQEVPSVRFAAVVGLSAAPEQLESAAASGVPTASHNPNDQTLLGGSLTGSGNNSGRSSCGGGGGGGGSGGGETGSRVVFCSGGGSSFGHQQQHRRHSSPLAMTDVLRTNNPSGGSPSTMMPRFGSSPANMFFGSAGTSGGGGGSGGGSGGRGGFSGASAHGDPQLGPSTCSSWDSSDCSRAQISAANAQTTMQTVANASLFASRTS